MARKLRRSIICGYRLAHLSSLAWRYRSGDAVLKSAPTERWPSGRRRTPGKCVYGNVSRVRIPPSPPFLNCGKFNNVSKTPKTHISCGLRHCCTVVTMLMEELGEIGTPGTLQQRRWYQPVGPPAQNPAKKWFPRRSPREGALVFKESTDRSGQQHF